MLQAVEQRKARASFAGHADRRLRNPGAGIEARARRALQIDTDRSAQGLAGRAIKLE